MGFAGVFLSIIFISLKPYLGVLLLEMSSYEIISRTESFMESPIIVYLMAVDSLIKMWTE